MNRTHEPILIVGNFLSGRQYTRSMGEELSLRLQARGWRVITTSSQPGRVRRLIDMLSATLIHAHDYRIALIEVYSGLAFLWAEAVCALLIWLDKPFVLVLHGGGLPKFAEYHPGRVNRLLHLASKVVTPSRWIASTLSTVRDDIQYLPNGIQVDSYRFIPRSKPSPRLCWLRAFHSIYRPWVAVETLSIVRKFYHSSTLLMIGPDKKDGSFEKTKSRARELGVEDLVVLTGGINKSVVPDWLNRADIFLNTTVFESFGVALVEAAACGLPIVTTNVGELPLLWNDNQDALLVSPDDSEAMAASVYRILTDSMLAEKLSVNGRKKVEQFDWANILPIWEELLGGM